MHFQDHQVPASETVPRESVDLLYQRTLGTYPYSIIHLIVGVTTLILMQRWRSFTTTTTASEISTVKEHIHVSGSQRPHLGQLDKYYKVLSLVGSSTVVRLDFQVVQLAFSNWSMSFCHRVNFM